VVDTSARGLRGGSLSLAAPERGPRKLYANLGRAAGQDDDDAFLSSGIQPTNGCRTGPALTGGGPFCQNGKALPSIGRLARCSLCTFCGENCSSEITDFHD
jgi:hypothetical protein